MFANIEFYLLDFVWFMWFSIEVPYNILIVYKATEKKQERKAEVGEVVGIQAYELEKLQMDTSMATVVPDCMLSRILTWMASKRQITETIRKPDGTDGRSTTPATQRWCLRSTSARNVSDVYGGTYAGRRAREANYTRFETPTMSTESRWLVDGMLSRRRNTFQQASRP